MQTWNTLKQPRPFDEPPAGGPASLGGQSVNGYQRTCNYMRSSGQVRVVVPIGQSCPESIAN
jgi:hypothetical protein